VTAPGSEPAGRSAAPGSEHAERSAAGPAPAGGVAVGVGLRPGAPAADLAVVVAAALAAAGVPPPAVATLATLDRRAAEPAVRDLAARHGWPVAAYPAADLDRVPVPADDRTRRAVGTGSVAEAAALLAAGPGAVLLVPKTTGGAVTVAVARA
jgi:cobalamin biosynthesis protein CbiG